MMGHNTMEGLDDAGEVSKCDIVHQLLCMACLGAGQTLHVLKDEALDLYNMTVNRGQQLIHNVSPRVCWECKILLQKVIHFRERVTECYNILSSSHVKWNEVTRPSRLQMLTTAQINIPPMDQEFSLSEVTQEIEEVKHHELSETEDTQPCMSCLCGGRQLNNIRDKMLKYYTDILNQKMVVHDVFAVSSQLCWECCSMLRQATHFSEQLVESYQTLLPSLLTADVQDITSLLYSGVSLPPRLRRCVRDRVDIPPHACTHNPPSPTKLEPGSLEFGVSSTLPAGHVQRPDEAAAQVKQTSRRDAAHVTTSNITCDRCHREFTSKQQLIRHIAGNIYPHNTNVCDDNSYVCVEPRRRRQSAQVTSHAADKQYMCTQYNKCSKEFSRKHDLAQQIRTHNGERPCQCSQCSKAYIQKQHLVDHIKTHAGEKPYLCNQCSNTYTRKDHLVDHITTHTDDIVPCVDAKCVRELLAGKLITFIQKKDMIESQRPTPDLCISQTAKCKRRNFNRSVYKTRWVAGCSHLNKLFCWYCIFFSNGKNVWNSTGYDDLNNLSYAIKRHQNTPHHLHAVIAFHKFGNRRMDTSLSRQLSEEITKHNLNVDHNRRVFQRLVDVVCLLAQQELPFRSPDQTKSSLNRGNFLELVSLLSKYDIVLEGHVQQQGNKQGVRYCSNKIQNDIIHSVADVMQVRIASEIQMSAFVSVIIDDTPDVSSREQCCMILRYFSGNDIHDRFLGFIDVSESRTADALTEIVMSFINKYDCKKKVVAQSYDGASVMSGCRNDVQQKVKEFCPHAIYIWCNAHILNLVLSKSCSRIGEVSSFFYAIQALITFFSSSAKITAYYNKYCSERLPHIPATGWALTTGVVNTVFEQKNILIGLFAEMADHPEQWDGDTNLSVEIFYNSLKSFNFNFFLEVFHNIFQRTDSLYNIVQKSQVDVGLCLNKIKEFHTWLRKDFQLQFDKIYADASENNSAPRLRRNISCARSEYKRIFIQIIENVSSEIKYRYSEIFKLQFFQLFNKNKYFSYKKLFPKDYFFSLEEHYGDYFDKLTLKNQLTCLYSSPEWKDFSIFQLVDFINENGLQDAFSELLKLAYLVITIPATSASAERAFSALKRIQSYLMNTQGQDRLSELSMIAVEKNLLTDLKRSPSFYDDVIKSFLKKDGRLDLEYK